MKDLRICYMDFSPGFGLRPPPQKKSLQMYFRYTLYIPKWLCACVWICEYDSFCFFFFAHKLHKLTFCFRYFKYAINNYSNSKLTVPYSQFFIQAACPLRQLTVYFQLSLSRFLFCMKLFLWVLSVKTCSRQC